jgi:hypothetical protein
LKLEEPKKVYASIALGVMRAWQILELNGNTPLNVLVRAVIKGLAMESDNLIFNEYRSNMAKLAFEMVFTDHLPELEIMILLGEFIGHVQAGINSRETYKEHEVK